MNEFSIVDFWNRIKELCANNCITQQELSLRLGLPQRTVERQIFNKANPNLDELVNMANYFNVSLNYLITGKSEITFDETAKTKELTENIKNRIDTKNFRLEKSLEARAKNKYEKEISLLQQKITEIKQLSAL